jgi:NAD(P)H-dependent flavin oxidoreductase YrpB (nitropropane dioxygenase family)
VCNDVNYGGIPLKIQSLTIDDLTASIPIVQGGMGIGVSGSSLAAAVANQGGIGVISGAQIGYNEPDFLTNTVEANIRALRKEIRRARELSPKGIIGVNFMVAMKNYKEMVKIAVEEKIDLIVSGAGLPLDLPSYVENSKTKLLPIVSSAKAANIIIKRWMRQGREPDAIVVEGPLAGGHLGFKPEQIDKEEFKLEHLVEDVVALLKKLNKNIPVIAGGGITTGADIAKFMKLGVSGVQIGSLFVPTEECDASMAFKETYLNASEEDIQIIKSPVGLPGRAIRNPFVERIEKDNLPVKKCFRCLETCDPSDTPYCISQALIDAVKTGEGLVFSGGKAFLCKQITTVKEVIDRLMNELQEAE